MTRIRYTGIADAKAAFAALAPLRQRLLMMQWRLRPFGADYLVIDAVKRALDTAAYHFTREPDFFTPDAGPGAASLEMVRQLRPAAARLRDLAADEDQAGVRRVLLALADALEEP
jgi:hypothetical protein